MNVSTHPTEAGGALGARRFTAMVVLGLVGQLAWCAETLYLPVFIFERVTPDPLVIAATVAASAAVGTVATLLVGGWSDRLGRRRVFLVVGYLLWGLATAALGFGDTLTGAAGAALVILLDCVMTFVGSAGYDAALQAWVTDITHPANRGRVEAVLSVLPLAATLLLFGGVDWLARAGHWRLLFGGVGATVALGAAVALVVGRDETRPHPARGLRPPPRRGNEALYLALAVWAVWGVATQVYQPYLLIYLQQYLRLDGYALVLGILLVGAAAVTVASGRLIDRFGKVRFLVPALLVYCVGLLGMAVARGTGPLIVAGVVMMSGYLVVPTTVGALVRDLTPPDRAGQVQGARMIATVLVPMLVGPFIGAAVTGTVPGPSIFVAALVVALLGLLPLGRLRQAIACHQGSASGG